MQFSGAVRVSDLNDYISPSNACIVALNGSLKVSPTEPNDQVAMSSRGRMQQSEPSFPHWTQAQAKGPNESVKVTLHDCLACSGCVTSAESVMLESQSGAELLERLQEGKLLRDWAESLQKGSSELSIPPVAPIVVVVSVSPQSKASLAAFYGVSASEAFSRLSGWLKERGAEHVFDVEIGRDVTLIEAAADFITRLRSRQASQQQTGEGGGLPMLASSCPGWVVYAEKTQGDFVLPYLSSTRSPQGVMGSLIKRVLSPGLMQHLQGLIRVEGVRLYHATIMPCFDKKLEAVRDELTFVDPVTGSTLPEADCCLTTSEIERIWADSGVSDICSLPADDGRDTLRELILGRPDERSATAMEVDSSSEHAADATSSRVLGSGGYFDFIFRAAAKEVFGITLSPGPLSLQPLRNSDFQELTLSGGVDGQPPLMKFALCYGFRNIQSLMRKIKSGKCDYDFVEVMACPSGCLNGGGQIKPSPGETSAQLLERLEAAFDGSTRLGPGSEQDELIKRLYEVGIKGGPGSEEARSLLHTTFKKRDRQGLSNALDF